MSDQLGFTATEDRTMPAVAYALYLLAFATGVTAIIGLIIAYANRDGAGAKMRTHYTFLIRTFWMTIGWWLLGGFLILFGMPLVIVIIGFPIMMLGGLILAVTGVWYALRCILGVIYLARDEPYPRPQAWLA